MRKVFVPLLALAGFIFMTAPIIIVRAPFESTMGLVQKIFYFHMPPAMLMLLSAIFCGIVSGLYLIKRRPVYDWIACASAELTVLYGAMAMVTGPLWARKAWGVWWVWDPRITMSLLLWMIFVSYLLLRRYGGPGSETLSAGLAVFGMATSPFVYLSVNIWRTIHPLTTVVPTCSSCGPGAVRKRTQRSWIAGRHCTCGTGSSKIPGSCRPWRPSSWITPTGLGKPGSPSPRCRDIPMSRACSRAASAGARTRPTSSFTYLRPHHGMPTFERRLSGT